MELCDYGDPSRPALLPSAYINANPSLYMRYPDMHDVDGASEVKPGEKSSREASPVITCSVGVVREVLFISELMLSLDGDRDILTFLDEGFRAASPEKTDERIWKSYCGGNIRTHFWAREPFS